MISESCRPFEFFVPIFCGRVRRTLTFSIYAQKRRNFDALECLGKQVEQLLIFDNLDFAQNLIKETQEVDVALWGKIYDI